MRCPRRLVAGVVALAVAGCAAVTAPADGTYVGVFTGQFVDGMPLYRLPPVEVVGSRRGVAGSDTGGVERP